MNLNPKSKKELKSECHRLLREIFFYDKGGRAVAYAWLHRKYKKPIHFSRINNKQELRKIYDDLWLYSFNHKEKEYKPKKIKQLKQLQKQKIITPSNIKIKRNVFFKGKIEYPKNPIIPKWKYHLNKVINSLHLTQIINKSKIKL
jgi:hypothetical protein